MRQYLTIALLSAAVGAGVASTGLLHEPAAELLPFAQGQATSFEARAEPSPPLELTPDELRNIRVYETAIKSVVNINTSIVQYDAFFMVQTPGHGSGSGSVLDQNGHILTNYHVVENARDIEVTLHNGTTYDAELIGADAEFDMAVLKIDAPADELHPVELGKSDSLRVGQRVYAVGNPFGLEGTLTTGIVSSLNRTIAGRVNGRSMKSLIQTDAAMNPGNSGGPLLDTSARMVGMNVAIASKTGQNTGVGFAIPVNRIRQVVPELIEHGRIIRPDHGIAAVMNTDRGVKIVKLVPDGPADRAGLRGYRVVRERRTRGGIIYENRTLDRNSDYITAVDGVKVNSHDELLDELESHEPGETVELTIIRDGREMRVPITLGGS